MCIHDLHESKIYLYLYVYIRNTLRNNFTVIYIFLFLLLQNCK